MDIKGGGKLLSLKTHKLGVCRWKFEDWLPVGAKETANFLTTFRDASVDSLGDIIRLTKTRNTWLTVLRSRTRGAVSREIQLQVQQRDGQSR